VWDLFKQAGAEWIEEGRPVGGRPGPRHRLLGRSLAADRHQDPFAE
jgi:hypothetical protein